MLATSTINNEKLKKIYLDGCKARSIKPRKTSFKNFVAFLEKDAHYWMNANLKFFFEQLNH